MIREIFVPLLRFDSDAAAIDAALSLAKAHDAHISALVTLEHPMPLVTEFGYVPVEASQRELDEASAAAEAQAARARTQLAREAVSSEVRLTEVMMLWSEETAALHARHADISVLGGPDPKQASPRFALTFKSLLLSSGRPVLVVPTGASLPSPLRRVVLAWKPTAEATRALHDALPLLAGASEIDVLMIDPQVAEGRHGEQPGADIARHLSRHGLTVNVVSMPKEGRSIGANLLRHAQEVDADLLVMGGYGHAHWREVILGGATRTVLDGMRKAVLFSH
jgi:nucleotide-binding universal stress UspA family protein